MNEKTIELLLTKNRIALIDYTDRDLCQFKWCYDRYVMRREGYKKPNISIHRVILERIIGRKLHSHEYCDHINGNPLDNRRSNLRLTNAVQNSINRRPMKGTKTGYKGVSKKNDRVNKPYEAKIRVNGKRISLGHFSTAKAAYSAYCEAAIKYHGEYARLK